MSFSRLFCLIVKTNLKTGLFSFFSLDYMILVWFCLILFEVFLTSFFFFGFYKKKKAQESFFSLWSADCFLFSNTFSLPFDVYSFFFLLVDENQLLFLFIGEKSSFFLRKREDCPWSWKQIQVNYEGILN